MSPSGEDAASHPDRWGGTDGVPRVISVRRGQVQPSGSWLYVWVDASTAVISYVGATGFDPELRAYVHVTSDDPALGRVRAGVADYDQRDFDVLAFELPDSVDRAAARKLLAEALIPSPDVSAAVAEAPGLHEILAPIIAAIENYRAGIPAPSPGS